MGLTIRRENNEKIRLQKSIVEKKDAISKLEEKITQFKTDIDSEIQKERSEKHQLEKLIEQMKKEVSGNQ